ncbi:Tn3 family transposase [Paraburkholderia sp. GAS348]|uniref:Tn3 family transposase n=1 Tax=Paraburkholderia sp. GAS348 TaxID=3035132 RepID=UPI003D1FD5ED
MSQIRDFDEYLKPCATFGEQQRENQLRLAVETSAALYLDERLEHLHEALDEISRLVAAGKPPDVGLHDRGPRISPPDDATLAEANVLRPQAYDLMPRVKSTDRLLEVDLWTDFTRRFTHRKCEAKAPERTLLLTAILVDAFNLGLEKMVDTCAGTSAAKLAWLVAWYIRDETHQKGSEELANYLHCLPFTTYWGAGTTAPPITTTSFLSFILHRTS